LNTDLALDGIILDDYTEHGLYFDHGVGSVNLCIQIELINRESLLKLRDISIKITEFDEITRKIRKDLFSSCKNISPTKTVGVNAILRVNRPEELKKIEHEKKVVDLISKFTGKDIAADDLNPLPNQEGIVCIAGGWDGQIARSTIH
jgi:hypothetical protein